MALSDHLRELRARILKVALTLLVALVVALFFFDQLFDLVYGPYEEAVARLEDKQTLATTTGGVARLSPQSEGARRTEE